MSQCMQPPGAGLEKLTGAWPCLSANGCGHQVLSPTWTLSWWARQGQGNLSPSKCQVPITAGWTGEGMMLGEKPSHCWMENDDWTSCHTHNWVWTTDWGWSILTGDHGCIKACPNCFAGNRGDYGNVSLVHGSYLFDFDVRQLFVCWFLWSMHEAGTMWIVVCYLQC